MNELMMSVPLYALGVGRTQVSVTVITLVGVIVSVMVAAVVTVSVSVLKIFLLDNLTIF